MKTTYGTMYYVSDMKQSVEFFKTNLALKPSYQSEDWTEFAVGEHRLCLHIKRSGEKASENGILIFSHDGIKNLFEKMKNDQLNVFGLHEIHPGAWTFHVKDANQNEFSFHGSP